MPLIIVLSRYEGGGPVGGRWLSCVILVEVMGCPVKLHPIYVGVGTFLSFLQPHLVRYYPMQWCLPLLPYHLILATCTVYTALTNRYTPYFPTSPFEWCHLW